MAKDRSVLALTGDIGGTHARFALARRSPAGRISLEQPCKLLTADWTDLESAIEAYFARTGGAKPESAALGVAGPVGAGVEVKLTNLPWRFSRAAMQRRFGWTKLEMLNDFAALGWAAPALDPADWRPLAGPDWPGTLPDVVTVAGPGTGFGVALAAHGRVLATEGGHAGFAPTDAVERDILGLLTERYGHCSIERLLSGPGLQNLYACLAARDGRSAESASPERIVAAALSGEDSVAEQTLQRFGLMLGATLGDLALAHGAQAVAIGGGLAPRLLKWIDTPTVRTRFEAKGRARTVLETVPWAVIVNDQAALIGAANLVLP